MLGGVVAMAVAAGFIAWLATRSGGSAPASVPPARPAQTAAGGTASTRPAATAIGPIALDAEALRAVAGSLGQPVYWVGSEAGYRYELHRTTAGNVFVRYLPRGVAAGDPRAFRTVGTYPFTGAYAATKGVAKERGSVFRNLKGGWLAVYRPSKPTSIYLARAGFDYQLEIFDPSAARARQLVTSGRLRRVG
jgi:hypothetical protein